MTLVKQLFGNNVEVSPGVTTWQPSQADHHGQDCDGLTDAQIDACILSGMPVCSPGRNYTTSGQTAQYYPYPTPPTITRHKEQPAGQTAALVIAGTALFGIVVLGWQLLIGGF